MNKDPLESQIKQAMDTFQDGIDVSTQVKLNEARHAALNQKRPLRFTRLLAPVTGVASVMLFAFLLVQNNTTLESSNHEASLFEDLELLANEADPDFYEDLEFLTWLDENQLMDADI